MGRLSPSPPRAAPRSPPRPSRPPLVVNHGDLALLGSFEERYAKASLAGLAGGPRRRPALAHALLGQPGALPPGRHARPFSPARGTSPPRAASPRVIRAPSPPRSPAAPPRLGSFARRRRRRWRSPRPVQAGVASGALGVAALAPRSTPRGGSSPGASTTRAVASECAVSGGGLREATLERGAADDRRARQRRRAADERRRALPRDDARRVGAARRSRGRRRRHLRCVVRRRALRLLPAHRDARRRARPGSPLPCTCARARRRRRAASRPAAGCAGRAPASARPFASRRSTPTAVRRRAAVMSSSARSSARSATATTARTTTKARRLPCPTAAMGRHTGSYAVRAAGRYRLSLREDERRARARLAVCGDGPRRRRLRARVHRRRRRCRPRRRASVAARHAL